MDGQEGEREMEATYFVGGRIPMCENPERKKCGVAATVLSRVVKKIRAKFCLPTMSFYRAIEGPWSNPFIGRRSFSTQTAI